MQKKPIPNVLYISKEDFENLNPDIEVEDPADLMEEIDEDDMTARLPVPSNSPTQGALEIKIDESLKVGQYRLAVEDSSFEDLFDNHEYEN